MNDFDLSTSIQLQNQVGTNILQEGLKGGFDFLIDKFVKNDVLNKLLKDVKDQALGKTISETYQVYEGANGKPKISIQTYFIPGLFGFTDYKYLEKFANYSMLPEKILTEFIGYTQYIYSPTHILSLDTDLFALKINNIMDIPGGLYITNFSRKYSMDKDENGLPIFCQASIELEYHREMYADEFVKLFS